LIGDVQGRLLIFYIYTMSRKAIELSTVQSTLLQKQLLGPVNKFNTNDIVRQLGYVQIDTLAVVARAHHHVLWSRNPDYQETELNKLMRQKKVFEYWSHAASILPIEDFRFSLPRKQLYRDGHHHWFAKNKRIMKYVLDRIKAEGPLQSKDFETDRKRGSWFDWKPAKIALEQLFMEGSLMITERKGFQKVYDLTERAIPSDIDTAMPTEEEYAEHLVRNNMRSLGIFSLKDVIHLRSNMQPAVKRTLETFIASGLLEQVKIEGAKTGYYLTIEKRATIKKSTQVSARLLSPFDNLVIRRERLKDLFGFDYTLECYLPEHKRKYGYFSLPILYGNQFLGSLDPKADRANGVFTVKALHIETFNTEIAEALASELKRFAAFNSCTEFDLKGIRKTAIRSAMKSALQKV
jgi:uncharacterized protein YcaQ